MFASKKSFDRIKSIKNKQTNNNNRALLSLLND